MHCRPASSRDIDSANLVLTIGQVMNVDWATVLSVLQRVKWHGWARTRLGVGLGA
jgi:hypothetical protein